MLTVGGWFGAVTVIVRAVEVVESPGPSNAFAVIVCCPAASDAVTE
jgi:hypothetical protein